MGLSCLEYRRLQPGEFTTESIESKCADLEGANSGQIPLSLTKASIY